MSAGIGTTLRRIFRNAFISFWRNGWVSLATVLVMVLALFVIGSLFLFQVMLRSTLDEVEKKVDVSVYFKTDADAVEVQKIRDLLKDLPEVKSLEYVSRDDALRVFKERHSGNALIASALDELGDNPLGATIKIRAKSPSQYESISNFLESGSFPSIDKVNYRQNKLVFDRLASVLSASQKVGAGISLVLGAIAFLVAFNTIRLAIFTARDEIGVMRLVGASNWFIRSPFLVEGAMHGIFAALVATLFFWPITLWLGPKAQDFLGGINVFDYYASNLIQFFFILLLVGIVVGVFSSFVATRRYLKI